MTTRGQGSASRHRTEDSPRGTAAIDADRETVELTDDRAKRLRLFNLGMGILHLVSGTAMLALGNDFEISVSALNLNGPPGTPINEGTLYEVFGVRVAWATAAFLLLSAFFHFLIAAPGGFSRYTRELRHGRNRFRWVEYSLSATLMIVLIAMITGITDLAALIAIGFANAAMILFGWVMEMVNAPDRKPWWTPFWFGCIAGIGPWLAVVAYLVSNVSQPGAEGPPTFV